MFISVIWLLHFVIIVSQAGMLSTFTDYRAVHERSFDIMQRRITSFFRRGPQDPLLWIILTILAAAFCLLVADVAVWFLL